MGVLLRELDALYSAFASGRPSPLPELPVQYGDFAAWQREWLQGEVLEAPARLLAAAARGAAGGPRAAHATGRARRSRASGARGGTSRCPPRLGDALRELGQREGATLFMVLLAGFQALLRAPQRADGPGGGLAGRGPHAESEVEGLVGFFVNMLALRVDLSGDPSFRELLGRVREVVLGAQAHQELPFERLVEELESGRDPSRTPLFQVAFAFQNTPRGKLALRRPRGRARSASTRARFGSISSAYTAESTAGLGVTIRYNTDLFEAVASGADAGALRGVCWRGW